MSSSFVLVTLLALVATSSSHIIVWNSHLFDNGQEFYIRGTDYSPGIIGQCTTNFVTGYGGTGFCSAKLTPFNEYKSACYDSDYFDGRPWPQNTSVNGFQALWERDLPLIKQYGANTIRLYNCNPSTYAATVTYKNLFPFPNGKDHTLFMATAVKYGLRVAFPLNMANDDFPSLPTQEFVRYLRWQIDEVGNSPALLYWVLGNEQAWTWSTANVATASYVNLFNSYVDYAKRYTYSKWGRWVPISLSTHNSPYDAAELMPYLHLDFYSENFFSIVNSDYDWMMVNGITNNKVWFEGYKNLTCKYTKPFLITEFGKTYSVGQNYQQGSIPQILYNIYRYTQYGLLGGFYYEATDEPYAPNVNGQAYSYVFNNFGISSLSITPASNGQCNSNATNCFVPDTATIKTTQYNDITQGTYNGVNYGYLQSITTVLNRQLYTTSNVPDYCAALNYKQCPGASANTPMCSGNGMCNRILGQCVCGSGWGGADCSVPSCPNSCSGQGTCSSAVSPPECICNSGYYGLSCQSTLTNPQRTKTCPGVGGCTYGNGVCSNVTYLCTCWPGWTGLDCAVTDLTYAMSTSSSSSVGIASTSSTTSTTVASVSSASTTSAATTASVITSSVATTSSVSSTAATTTAATTTTTAALTTVSAATSSSTLSASTSSSAASTTSTVSISSATSAAKAASSSTTTLASTSTSGPSSSSSSTSSTSGPSSSSSSLSSTSGPSSSTSSTSGSLSSTSSTSGPSSSTTSTASVTKSTSTTLATTTSTTPTSATISVDSTVATSTSTSGPSSTGSSLSASSSTTSIRVSTSTSATSAPLSSTSSSSATITASTSTSTGLPPVSTASTSSETVSATASTGDAASATSSSTGQDSSTSSTSDSGASTSTSSTEGVSTTTSTSGTQQSTSSSSTQATTTTSSTKATSISTTSTSASTGSTTSTGASESSSSTTSSKLASLSSTTSKTPVVSGAPYPLVVSVFLIVSVASTWLMV